MKRADRNRIAKFQALLVLVLASVLFFLGACTASRKSSTGTEPPAKTPVPGEALTGAEGADNLNMILIDLTCLRAGNLSCHGYSRKTSPLLDSIASGEIWFESAFSQAYWTLPSVASILTSRYVPSHEVISRSQKLGDSRVTLPEILRKIGYRTAAFVGGLDLDKVHNLGKGFDTYSDGTGSKPMGYLAENFPKALDWLRENGKGNFFLYLQGYELHPPYHYPRPYENMFDPDYRGFLEGMNLDYELLKGIRKNRLTLKGREIEMTRRDLEHIVARYDGGIRHVDGLLQDFIGQLRKLKLLDRTVIFIFADHGEELSDHGYFDRFGRANLYDETVHVPFFILHPHVKGVRIRQPVELIDIAPTVLGILGLPKDREMQGENLFPLIMDEAGRSAEKCVYSGWGEKQMARTARWKLIFNKGEFELYDVGKDPGEKENRLEKSPEKAAELSRKLFHWYVTCRSKGELGKTELSLQEMPRFLRRRELQRLEEERRVKSLLQRKPVRE